MNKIVKNQTKKILIMLIIIMLCSFVMPKYIYATKINGGLFFKPIAQFIAKVADLAIQAMQIISIGDGTMQVENSQYLIRISPGIIFSGEVPMFDINFINPSQDYKVKKLMADIQDNIFTLEELGVEDNTYSLLLSEDGIIYNFLKTGELKNNNGEVLKKCEPTMEGTLSSIWDMGLLSPEIEVEEILKVLGVEKTTNTVMESFYVEGGNNSIYPNECDITDVIYKGKSYDMVTVSAYKYNWNPVTEGDDSYRVYCEWYYIILDESTYEMDCIGAVTISKPAEKFVLQETDEVMESTAKQLRGFVSQWYNALKIVSLVGLLVVLVYVAIRILLSSTSKDKAKYKKMLMDWFVAICIVFVLQYIISLTLYTTGAISDFFAESVVGEYGEDVLMTEIRNMIGLDPDNFMEIFAEIVMYVVLVVYTVLFALQYLKRTIYMAFLTLIAPLVAFTYPLDKIKDGKAQAFSAWLKEFIYTALVQPVHLILYCMLVSSAIDFAKEVPIYAIVIIGFLLPAEKFVKKMFGMDRANTVGNMASALGGATIMNAINKLGSKSPKPPKTSGDSREGKVRTENEEGSSNISSLGEEGANVGGQGASGQIGENAKRNIKNGPNKGNGFKNVAKRYVFNKNTGKKLLRGTAKVAGAAALGTVGLAAGIATGEPENAFAGALGGISAGSRVGGNLVDGGANLITGAKEGIRNLGDTYKEGKYGEQEYEKMKFKNSEGYKNLASKYKGRENEINEFLNAGITDIRKIDIAMKNNKKYSTQEALQYIEMAKKCPDEILYSDESFKNYLEARNISTDNVKEMREGIVSFK